MHNASINNIIKTLVFLILILAGHCTLNAQDPYRKLSYDIRNYDFSKWPVPGKPPTDRTIRIIIDSDAKNEVDDQWSIALALLSTDRFEIECFVAANFDNSRGGPQIIDKSYDEIIFLLEKAGLKGKYPVYKGSAPMQYKYAPSLSEGIEFIIRTLAINSRAEKVRS